MKKTDLLKSISIENLQERQEFTVAEDGVCCEHCCENVTVQPGEIE